ncbi:MAG: ligC [Alphaproteobacteria bacterium]|jgi:ATP-dependent DNA ligase|nr:ligC [Alphaproteobacteria bacterium]
MLDAKPIGTEFHAGRYGHVPKPSLKFALPLDTPPMEAKLLAELPKEGGPWQYEPKWDGFRCLAFKRGDEVELRSKSGKPLGRYFPEIVAMLRGLKARQFVIDGELVIELEGAPSFDALQMRLHPAESRIKKLSAETPAHLIAFDMLADTGGVVLLDRPLRERRAALAKFMKTAAIRRKLILSPVALTRAKAMRWLGESGGATDGVVAKRLDDPYQPGERAMAKVKRIRTADCVVGGFRYESDGKLVGSLLLGLYNSQGKLDHVGFTATISDAGRPALTKKLEKLRGGPGFTGNAPGGPSRWSTERSSQWQPLKPKLVVEVKFDQVTASRFRHGTRLMRWRPDKAPHQCTFAQIAPVRKSRQA